MPHFDENVGFVSEVHTIRTLQTQAAEQAMEIQVLQEQWDEAAASLLRLRVEDEGWNILGGASRDEGFSLQVTKDIAKKAQLQSVGNPLLTRGFELRYDNVFSRGFTLNGEMRPRFKTRLEKTSNRQLMLMNDGYEVMERTLFDTGNLFLIYDRDLETLKRIPFAEIEGRATDPEDDFRTAYYLRSYNRKELDGKATPVTEWIPVVEWYDEGRDTNDKIGMHPVNHRQVIIDFRVNVPNTGHWGIPDCFAALPYAWAYAEYLRDASSLLKAYNMIAWRFVNKTKPQAQATGIKLSNVRKGPVAVGMTEGSELTAMPRAGQVDMNDGLALAAMAATAMSVPTTSLLSNAAIGGGFGAIASLDGPTVSAARERQQRWIAFYERVFLAMDIKNVTINFPKITEDPVHRQVQSLATARATGAIWADEYRAAIIEATDVLPLHDGAPAVDEYAQAQNALGFLQMMEQATSVASKDPLARRGNSGVAGALSDIDNTNRDLDTTPGTGSVTDLVG